jgi:RsmE family RNA methyltransferase
MNLLLLCPEDFRSADLARIDGRRYRHLVEILRTEPGRPLRVGLLGGLLGEARVVAQTGEHVDLAVQLSEPPPAPALITLVLALPRPKVLRRIVRAVTTCGIKRLVLINTARVDKSYWQSPLLAPAALHEQLLLGLEQARDTCLPEILLRPRFRPFVEDELPCMSSDSQRLVAHPGSDRPCPSAVNRPVTMVVGPEGGFIPFELALLTVHGFQPVHLGTRPLQVETAVPALLGRLLQL